MCHEGDWHVLAVVSVFALLLFIIAVFAGMSHVIWNRPRLWKYPQFRAASRFIFLRFKTSSGYWTLIVLLKGFLISLSTAVLQDGYLQVLWIACVLVIYLCGAVYIQPWRLRVVNLIDCCSSMLLVVFYTLVALAVKTPESASRSLTNVFWISSAIFGMVCIAGCMCILHATALPKGAATPVGARANEHLKEEDDATARHDVCENARGFPTNDNEGKRSPGFNPVEGTPKTETLQSIVI